MFRPDVRPQPSGRRLVRARAFLLAAGVALGAAAAAAQDAPPAGPPAPPRSGGSLPGGPPPDSPTTPPQGTVAREQMWPAPSAEDWAKPCLLEWQRSWDDALAVSKETGRPILICINMDGEIASEHYAGIRYRQPEIAKLYEPYVKVIASVYRHTPRDFDDQGRRIPCPRFGGVTCGEHIAIEPILYEKYLDEKRIAPRHIMIDTDGKETFDVFYANDTASVFHTIEKGVEGRELPPPVVRGDRPATERVASRHSADRTAVEKTYDGADAEQRKALLDAALKTPGTAPVDVLRLAVFGLDADAAKLARQALAQTDSADAVGLIADALRVPMEDAERQALIAALERLGSKSQRAQWLAVVHQGLSGTTGAVDPKRWGTPGGEYRAPEVPQAWTDLDARRVAKSAESHANPKDPTARIELAESYLGMAMEARKAARDDPKMARMLSELLFGDAKRAAEQAAELGAPAWRSSMILALCEYYGGDAEKAYVLSETAVKDLPADDTSWNSMAVLTVFAESRWKSIQKSVRARERFRPGLLADLNAANTVLLRHPLGTSTQAVWHYDFLTWLRAGIHAQQFLESAVARFPESAALHDRLRRRLLDERGADALEADYDSRLRAKDAPATLLPFAAKASSVAGDFHRRAGAREKALASMERAVALWDRTAQTDATKREEADTAVALIRAARARLWYELGDDDRALAEILASFERSRGAAGSKDGGGFTPGETAQMLLARLRERNRDADAQRLAQALAAIDPELLRPDRE